jgi:hypothetical protein
MYNKIELYADSTDITLMKAALIDLVERTNKEGDQYGISATINDLITQLQELKGAN